MNKARPDFDVVLDKLKCTVQWYTVASTANNSGEKHQVVEMEGRMKDFRGLAD